MAPKALAAAASSPIGDASDCTGAGFCLPGGVLVDTETVTGTGCSFSGTIDWGDGTSQSLGTWTATMQVTHQYTSPGLYTVTTSVQGTPLQDGTTCTVSDAPYVVEVPAPIDVQVSARATENPQPSATERSFTFDASGTTVTPSDVTLSYDWTLPDGSTGSGVTFTASLACSDTDQNLTANLVVHAVKGTADKTFSGSVPITVEACPTVAAAFTATREGATFLTTSYDFDASATTATPAGATLSYAWAFGDGSSGTGEAPSRTYACATMRRT